MAERDKIVCTCLELTRQGFVEEMSRHRALDFEKLLAKCGAGTRCTACRMDLETIYVESFDHLPPEGSAAGVSPTGLPPVRRSFYRRTLDALDRVTPMVPVVLRDFSPVIAGAGVDERIQVTNDAALWTKTTLPPPVLLGIVLRDATGRVVARQRYVAGAGESVEIPVSRLLLDGMAVAPRDSDDTLHIGSVEVNRRWRGSAVRGTTRPQIVLAGRGGCGSVHTQGPQGRGTMWYSALARPKEERLYLTVVNAAGRRLRAEISYPHGPASPALRPVARHIDVAPHGAALVEIQTEILPPDMRGARIFGIRCDLDGPNKTHIVCASPSLDRFAIDHPSES